MDELSIIIGKNIKTLLAYSDKQQKELAEAVGVSKATVTDWVKGIKAPRTNRIDPICEFLHCSRNDLFLPQMFTFTEFKNRSAKMELMNIIDNMKDDEINSTLAFVKTMRGLNERK